MDKFVYSLETLQHFLTEENENNIWFDNQWLSLEELRSLGYEQVLMLEQVQYQCEGYYSHKIRELNYLRANAVNHYNGWLLDEIGSKLEDSSWGFESETDYWAFKAGMLDGYLQEITSYDTDYRFIS
jgi:hypothetical protein